MNNKIIIVICCPSYESASDIFNSWVECLKINEPGSLDFYDNNRLCADVDQYLRYIFCDYRFENVFSEQADAIVSYDEFLLFETDLMLN